MFPYKELNKRTFKFYQKNTYREIEAGDVGYKVECMANPYPITLILAQPEVITAPVKAQIFTGVKIEPICHLVVNISDMTYARTDTFVYGLPIKTRPLFSTAFIASTSDLEGHRTLYIMGRANVLTGLNMEAETLFIDANERRHKLISYIPRNYKCEAIIDRAEKTYEAEIEPDFKATAIFLNHTKIYNSYGNIEKYNYAFLSGKDFANLSYKKEFSIKRGVYFG